MHCPQRGGAPLLLLALSLSILVAGALPAPRPSQQQSTSQRDEIGAAAGDAPLVGGAAAAAAGAAARPGRGLLKKPTKPPAPKPPLPNFEIGVPAPPKEQLKCVGQLLFCVGAGWRGPPNKARSKKAHSQIGLGLDHYVWP